MENNYMKALIKKSKELSTFREVNNVLETVLASKREEKYYQILQYFIDLSDTMMNLGIKEVVINSCAFVNYGDLKNTPVNVTIRNNMYDIEIHMDFPCVFGNDGQCHKEVFYKGKPWIDNRLKSKKEFNDVITCFMEEWDKETSDKIFNTFVKFINNIFEIRKYQEISKREKIISSIIKLG